MKNASHRRRISQLVDRLVRMRNRTGSKYIPMAEVARHIADLCEAEYKRSYESGTSQFIERATPREVSECPCRTVAA